MILCLHLFVFFFNDTATTEIYTLSLHDALPIYRGQAAEHAEAVHQAFDAVARRGRSEEHTSELQSRGHLVCRLLLEKKNFDPMIVAANRHHDLGARVWSVNVSPGQDLTLSVAARVARRTLLAIGAAAFFFFNDTATTEIYTLSLHDALPI